MIWVTDASAGVLSLIGLGLLMVWDSVILLGDLMLDDAVGSVSSVQGKSDD